MYLTSRPDRRDVSQGKLVSLTDYNERFNDILTPRELGGLRLLVTPFPQQQFNATADRKSATPTTSCMTSRRAFLYAGNGQYVMEGGDGKIKTFALRGVKDNALLA